MKKYLLSIILCLICSPAHATVWYACSGGGNWNASVWTSVLADQVGCTGATGTPVAGDTATLNSNSGNITITAAAAAATLTMTGYTGTLAVGAQTLTVTAGVTLGGTITATTGTLTLNGSQTLTSNSITWPAKLTVSGASTLTLVGNWINTGLVTVSAATVINVTTSETFTVSGGLSVNGTLSGNAVIIATGGTVSCISTNTPLLSSMTLAGNVTIGNMWYGTGTFTYSSGTISFTANTVFLLGGTGTTAPTLNTNGMSFLNLSLSNTYAAMTLLSPLSVSGTLSIFVTTWTITGAYNITCANLGINLQQNSNNSLILPAGVTLNVTNSMNISASITTAGVRNTETIRSATASSPIFINYTGSLANEIIVGAVFTDVQATGLPLYNYNGSTLTRTTGIYNVSPVNLNLNYRSVF